MLRAARCELCVQAANARFPTFAPISHVSAQKPSNIHTIYHMVDGSLTGLTLTRRDQGGLFMFMDDEYTLKGKPVNQVATALLHQHRPDYAHITVCGDVVVAGIDETGDE